MLNHLNEANQHHDSVCCNVMQHDSAHDSMRHIPNTLHIPASVLPREDSSSPVSCVSTEFSLVPPFQGSPLSRLALYQVATGLGPARGRGWRRGRGREEEEKGEVGGKVRGKEGRRVWGGTVSERKGEERDVGKGGDVGEEEG